MYKLLLNPLTKNYCILYVDENGQEFNIPEDLGNVDYRQYLIDTDGGLPIPEENNPWL